MPKAGCRWERWVNHVVAASEQKGRGFKPKRFGCFEVDDALQLRGHAHRYNAGLPPLRMGIRRSFWSLLRSLFTQNVDLDQIFLTRKEQFRVPAAWMEEMLSISTERTNVTATEQSIRSSLYEKAIGILIWLAFAAAGMVALYFLSFLAGD